MADFLDKHILRLESSILKQKKEIEDLKSQLIELKTTNLNESSVAGPQGPPGPKGEKGDPGPDRIVTIESKGPIGPKGDEGRHIENAYVSEGKLYLNFSDGNLVDTGPVVGPRGGQGIPGEKGERGLIGEQGPVGPKGDTGLQGPIGPRGLIGEQGPAGPAGPIGIEGPQGLPGLTGPKGDRGPVGEKGEQGLLGEQGPVGPMGPMGPQGPRGKDGKDGLPGKDGKDGDTVDLEPLKKELQVDLQSFKDNISASVSRKNLSSGSSGGGEVRLEFLDDVDRTTATTDGFFLKYDSSSGKFFGNTVQAGGGSGNSFTTTLSTEHIIPRSNNVFDLGSDTRRFRDLFLKGSTIKLGTANISATATGGIAIPAIKVGNTTIEDTADGIKVPSIKIGNATITATGGTLALPAGSSIGGEEIQISVSDEGTEVGNNVSFINFVGSGVAATGNTSHITVTVSGGGGGSGDVSNGFLTSTFTTNTVFQSALANTNSRITLVNTNLTGTNTAIRALVSDRAQVANVAGLAALGNTNSRIALINTNLTGTNTALRTLISDRAQVANVAGLAALGNTNSRLALINTNLTGTNTALRTLISDRLQVGNVATQVVSNNIVTSDLSIRTYQHNYEVKVITKTDDHPYHGSGSDYGYSLNGIEAPQIVLVPGVTYVFDQSDNSNTNHPLRFYRNAAKNTAYTTGVTTNGTPGSSGAFTKIAVTEATPSVLYYQCSSHGYMGAGAFVVNETSPQYLKVANAVSTLAGLTDVAKVTPTDGHVLKYSSSNTTYYFAAESGGGGSGTDTLARTGITSTNTALRTLISDRLQVANAVSTLAGLTDVAKVTPTNGHVLKYSSSNTTYYFAAESGGGGTSPAVTGVSPSTIAPSTSTQVTITGTDFASVPIVNAINGSTGAIITPTAVSFTNSTTLVATFNIATKASYYIRVENATGLAGRSSSAVLAVSDAPTWTTSAGSLGTVGAGTTVNLTAIGTSDSTVSVSETTSVLTNNSDTPTSTMNLTLNSSNGNITGTAPSPGASTTYNFTLRLTDAENQTADRAFSITVTSGIQEGAQFIP